MNGISQLVSIMMDSDKYQKLSRLEQLNHDLGCAEMSGMNGYFTYEKKLKRIDDIKFMIQKEYRKSKLQKINNINDSEM
jgi:hypothetical protein